MAAARPDLSGGAPSPDVVEVRGARVHNLRGVDVDVPLRRLVAIAGVSGSGKSSLAMGVLYAEGSRRYVEALSTYTRRRMSHATRAAVDSVRHVPAALALRQRPGVPGVRSTFGTSSELLNVLRVLYSRLGSHLCRNGHRLEPTIDVAADLTLTCPVCSTVFSPPGAESFAFNSDGACPTCSGTGTVRSKSGTLFELDFTYRNARRAVQEALDNASSEKGMVRVSRFITAGTCRTCHGSRLSPAALGTHVDGINLAQASALALDDAVAWSRTVPGSLPAEMRPMAELIAGQFDEMARRLTQLGLGYLSLDRASATLSTGERQRVQLARAVRNETTGVLYVLDEPSIGLHPANVDGLIGVTRDLLRDGNSVVVVDHDVQVLREADWMIEIGPGSGADGGTVLSTGTIADLAHQPESLIHGFLAGEEPVIVRTRATESEVFSHGAIEVATSPIHTVHALEARFPIGRLTAVTGMSGSGKTTLVLDSLVPALQARAPEDQRPSHVVRLEAAGLARVDVVDATPIGTNVRSTVATYSGALDGLRRAYAAAEIAHERGLTASDFSYNTGSLRCPRCEGTGQVVLDVQFLPDLDIPCPDCGGSRYGERAHEIVRPDAHGSPLPLPEILGLTAREAAGRLSNLPKVRRQLDSLADLGLGYLTLGEDTPALSGGEAQRLKLATELRRDQSGTLFVLDEPSVGLHPLDTRVLLDVLERLRSRGATIIVIEHDLDMIANADHVIDLGPGGGSARGRIVATGTPERIAAAPDGVTGPFLAATLS